MNPKLERLHEYVLPTVATLAGMGFAIYCGRLTGRGQMGILGMLLSSCAVLTMLLIMRRMIWLWIPLTWSLSGQIPILPLPFSVRDLVVMSVLVCFLVLKALKVVHRKIKFSLTDLLMGVVLIYLVVAFIRNPVGVQALGSEKVGGRPYLNVAIGYFAYWVLIQASIPAAWAKVLPFIMAFGQAFEGILSAFLVKFPGFTPIVTTFYTGVSTAEYDSLDVLQYSVGQGSGRRPYLSAIGQPIANLLMSFYRPLTLINPIYVTRCIGFAVALGLVALSGFRSVMVAVFAFFAISSYLRRGWSDLIRASVVAIPILALVVAMQGVVFDLPLSFQRTLSFLPGKWNYIAIAEARGSSQWRFEMWEQMLFTDKYIDNKWLGDGFGFTRRQFDVMQALSTHGVKAADLQESFMITGGVHSGPVSAIRYVGYIGLFIYVVLLAAVGRDAWKLIHRARSTPFFPLALFIGAPMVWEPFHFVFIFGGYETSLPATIYWIGLLKMLQNSMDDLNQPSEKLLIKEPQRRTYEPAFAGHPRIKAS